jgi:hypothetical protein
MTKATKAESVRLGKSIEFYRTSILNFVEFSKTDKRSKPQLVKRLAALEKEAAGDTKLN